MGIMRCESELLLLWNEIESGQSENGQAAALRLWNKHLDTAYREYLKTAISLCHDKPETDVMTICLDALHDFDVMTLYDAAAIDIINLKANLNELNKKELLIGMCHTEVTMVKAMDNEIN